MEQDTVKVVKRTTGLVLILAVVAGLIGILLWFFGSPWGASGAQKAVQAYVAQTYPEIRAWRWKRRSTGFLPAVTRRG